MGNKQTEAPSPVPSLCLLPETPPFRDAFLEFIDKTRERFHHYTERNAANEQQTLLPGHAGADENCGNDGEQCCHLASQHGYSPFPSGLPVQQGDRWNGSLLLSVA